MARGGGREAVDEEEDDDDDEVSRADAFAGGHRNLCLHSGQDFSNDS